MARREIKMEELVEVLYQCHSGRSVRQISKSVGMSRKTIGKYLGLAKVYGFSRGDNIQPYQYYLELSGKIQAGLKVPLENSASYKKTSRYQDTIEKLLKRPYMNPKQVYRVLSKNYGYGLSYSSFNRYMNIKYPKAPRNCLRLEVMAGAEAQVDFGSAGMIYDPSQDRLRRAHAFVMSLSYSRLHYVEFVFDQGQVTFVKCHIRAFEFFGGVAERLIIDNLKSGVLTPSTYDPVFNKTYAECAKHYGFIIDPAKVRRPEHKGKVERKIPVVRSQFLSSYDFKDIKDANEKVKDWCLNDYGRQVHGTTKRKPYEVFLKEEKSLLKKLPVEQFDIPLWKKAKVHPDHHIVFDKSYYSLPTRYIGKKVWARGGIDRVQVFYDGELIKTHERSYTPGKRITHESDYPPEKSKYLLRTKEYYRREGGKYGIYVAEFVSKIMEVHVYSNLRKVQAVLRMTEKYGADAVDRTCRRCLHYEDYRMPTIRKILKDKLYNETLPEEVNPAPISLSAEFVRSPLYFDHTQEDRR